MLVSYYPLEHPIVQRVRTAFYAALRNGRTMRRSKLSFEQIYAALKDESVCLRSVAARAGIEYKFFLTLYERILQELFGNLTAEERRFRTQRQETLQHRFATFDEEVRTLPWMSPVIAAAERFGHTTAPYITTYDGGRVGPPHHYQLLISGTPCLIHPIERGHKTNPSKYQRYGKISMLPLNIQRAEVHIFPILVPQTGHPIYLFSSGELLSENDKVLIRIPLKHSTRRVRRKSRFDFASARDNWGIIPVAP